MSKKTLEDVKNEAVAQYESRPLFLGLDEFGLETIREIAGQASIITQEYIKGSEKKKHIFVRDISMKSEGDIEFMLKEIGETHDVVDILTIEKGVVAIIGFENVTIEEGGTRQII